MLVLFETSAGYALFSVKNDGKLQDVNNLYKEFESPEKAKKLYAPNCAEHAPAACGGRRLIGMRADATGCRLGGGVRRLKLKAFGKFENTAEALGAATAIADGKLSKGPWAGARAARCVVPLARPRSHDASVPLAWRLPAAGLRKFLKEHIVSKEVQDTLAVADKALGGLIKDKLGIQCAHDAAINELYRGIRAQLTSLISGAAAGRALRTTSARPR